MLGFDTARLRMRPLDATDEALYRGLYTDAETMRHICAPLSPQRVARSFQASIRQPRPPAGPFLFAVLEKPTLRRIGICAAVRIEPETARAEVGVMLQSDARGRGYARESLRGMVHSTFRAHPVETVWVQCSALNPVVERMVGSIGFVLDEQAMAGLGPLLQRTWSVRRFSWCFVDTTNHRGDVHVERHQVS